MRFIIKIERMYVKLKYFLIFCCVLLLGLASRHYAAAGTFVYDHLGDGLWAAMIYFGFRFLMTRASIKATAYGALSFCFLIELSQLYQAEWINAIRHTVLGGLVLGFGFLWSDMVSYTVGVFLAWQIDDFHTFLLKKPHFKNRNRS